MYSEYALVHMVKTENQQVKREDIEDFSFITTLTPVEKYKGLFDQLLTAPEEIREVMIDGVAVGAYSNINHPESQQIQLKVSFLSKEKVNAIFSKILPHEILFVMPLMANNTFSKLRLVPMTPGNEVDPNEVFFNE